MKRVCVIGCPGSGKSTFARALREITGLPICHLDLLHHNPDRTTVDRAVFIERLDKVLPQERWIIDGNYSATMELRLAACDTVFFFDLPAEVCLAGVESRRGKVRPDMPWVEMEEDPEFTEYIKNFSSTRRPEIMALLRKYADKTVVVFRSRAEANAYIQKLRETDH
ncbi:MAG: adenylate kinase [Clostridia bacterium]|nr:adenylate kinase [Clostridia bacterium]